MKRNNHTKSLSPKTKKILTGVGIGFGTVIIFFVSFFISFYFIINPITFTSTGNSSVADENRALKEQVQSLQDEIDYLEAREAKEPQGVVPAPDEVESSSATTSDGDKAETSKKEEKPKTNGAASSNTDDSKKTDTKTETTDKADGRTDKDKDDDETFQPDTVVTEEGNIDKEADEPIPVIDLSE